MCDDGNRINGDGCDQECNIENQFKCVTMYGQLSICKPISLTRGNGVIDDIEECDDGNIFNGDGCSADMTVEPGYVCKNEPGKKSVCRSICGDGIRTNGD